jgi:hypothetical protein
MNAPPSTGEGSTVTLIPPPLLNILAKRDGSLAENSSVVTLYDADADSGIGSANATAAPTLAAVILADDESWDIGEM